MTDVLTVGYTQFGNAIELDSGKRIEAWYPESNNPERRWMVRVTDSGVPLETEYVSLGNNSYGPSVDDVLKLETVTKRLGEHYS